jgi:hypothetical protein
MHTALIFKEQAKVKELGLKEKYLAQPHYSIKQIEGYDLLCCKDNKQDLHSSIIETNNKEYFPGTMNIYFIRHRLELKRLSGIPRHGLVLQKILNIDCFCSIFHLCQTTNKDHARKKYGLHTHQNVESDPWIMVCVDLVGPFMIKTPARTHSMLVLTMIDPATC